MTTLYEARIVLPFDASAEHVRAHEWLRARLVASFGGYTTTHGQGGRRAPRPGEFVTEANRIYDVAIPSSDDQAIRIFRQLALHAGKLAGQKCVYARLPTGVELLDVPQQASLDEIGEKIAATQAGHPLGAKRTPGIWEVWRTRGQGLAAVTNRTTRLDGGYQAVLLKTGKAAGIHVGHVYSVDLDGCVLDPKAEHPLDLVSFIAGY